MYQAQSAACLAYCGPLTPNGCDCFGCCNLPAGTDNWVFLGSEDANGDGSCTLADVNDPSKCQPCMPVKGCLNPCGTCELCIGKNTLPPECYPSDKDGGAGGGSSGTGGAGGGVSDQCPAGVTPCGLPGQALCTGNEYCITGCCRAVPN